MIFQKDMIGLALKMEMNAAVEIISHERYRQILPNAKSHVQATRVNFVVIHGVYL